MSVAVNITLTLRPVKIIYNPINDFNMVAYNLIYMQNIII